MPKIKLYPLVVLIIALLSQFSSADEFFLDSNRNNNIFRLEIDNDAIWKNDSNFTNGWSLQYHTQCFSAWEETQIPPLLQWIGKNLLGPMDTPSVVRVGHGLGQNMITPGDLSVKIPKDGDLPYAGTLTYALTWQRFNRSYGKNLQLSIGILGKESFAEDFQKFVHNDIGIGSSPQGWDSQRDSEPIFNASYEHLFRIAHWGDYINGWAGQVTVIPTASFGNLFTALELATSFRFGWNILEGFTSYPAPPSRGIFHSASLPKPSRASPHSFEFLIGARVCDLIYSVIYDGSIITDDDRKVERNNLIFATGVGVIYRHYDFFSISLMIQRSSDLLNKNALPEPTPEGDKTNTDVSYGAVLFDFYF